MAFGFLANLALPVAGADGFPGAVTQATSGLDDRRVINIAPVGINLGEMLAPVMQGGAPGADYAPPSRWSATGAPAPMLAPASSGGAAQAGAGVVLIAGAAVAALAVGLFAMRGR